MSYRSFLECGKYILDSLFSNWSLLRYLILRAGQGINPSDPNKQIHKTFSLRTNNNIVQKHIICIDCMLLYGHSVCLLECCFIYVIVNNISIKCDGTLLRRRLEERLTYCRPPSP